MTRYRFLRWETPGEVSPKREINVISNMELIAYYEVIGMGTVTFSGALSAQEQMGETVSIIVTKPDSTTELVSTVTDADGNYAVDYTNVPGDYNAVARVEADNLYDVALSDLVIFSVGKLPRTITLNVDK